MKNLILATILLFSTMSSLATGYINWYDKNGNWQREQCVIKYIDTSDLYQRTIFYMDCKNKEIEPILNIVPGSKTIIRVNAIHKFWCMSEETNIESFTVFEIYLNCTFDKTK